MATSPTALIAEDEPLLAADLQARLARLWPELSVVERAAHGEAAVDAALRLLPQLLFLDIRMPGMSGLEAAAAIVDEWPEAIAPPLIVFVTAYDRYAVQAFEHAAFDYVLKPVDDERLARTVARAQQALRQRTVAGAGGAVRPWDDLLGSLQRLLAASQAAPATRPPPLQVIQAGAGNAIRLVPIDDVVYFEAADKYVRVVTADAEHLIRVPLRELLPQLDEARFWQIHRGTVVRADAIALVRRDESGKLSITLRDRPERLAVSRLYAHLFKAM